MSMFQAKTIFQLDNTTSKEINIFRHSVLPSDLIVKLETT